MLAIAVDCSLTIAGVHAVVCSFAIAGIPAVVCCLAIAGAQFWLLSLLLLVLLKLPGDVLNFSSSAVATCSGVPASGGVFTIFLKDFLKYVTAAA
jgi:hypothetical protein